MLTTTMRTIEDPFNGIESWIQGAFFSVFYFFFAIVFFFFYIITSLYFVFLKLLAIFCDYYKIVGYLSSGF